MARFEINEPIATTEPTITVENELAIGRHRFRLEVTGRQGRPSAPDEAIVEIRRLVIDPRQPTGPVIDPRPPVLDPRVITGPIVTPSRRTRAPRKKEKP
jgi:hypothetical protein